MFYHHRNMPMQYTEILEMKKLKISSKYFLYLIFLYFAHNLDCGYTLEQTCRGGSNKDRQSMFWYKNKMQCIPQ